MISARIRSMTGAHWIALFALIAACWAVLYLMALPPADLRAGADTFGWDYIVSLCTLTPDAAGFARMVLMWALMAGAMMAPTALPAFATYDDLSRRDPAASFGALVGGYLLVWLGFAVVAAGLQFWAASLGLVGGLGQATSLWLTAALLALAGAYQFTPLKDACLVQCQAPLAFFMSHWSEGGFRNGLRLGAVCLGCCWALMLLAFVGGVMNLAFMGLAMILMTLEKLPEIGRPITRPLGAVLFLAAVALVPLAALT
jgi:predicted metal-binding membrane protein